MLSEIEELPNDIVPEDIDESRVLLLYILGEIMSKTDGEIDYDWLQLLRRRLFRSVEIL